MNIRRRIIGVLRSHRFDADLREELEFHRAEMQGDLERRGMKSDDAACESRRRMGNTTLAREDAHDVWIWRWVETTLQDVRYAVRAARKAPGFYAAAALTVALGIALTTTMFSVADNILYRPLPYPQAFRLYKMFGAARNDTRSQFAIAPGDYLSWRTAGAFMSIGAFRWGGAIAADTGLLPHRVNSAFVDDQFLPTLGVAPMIGRGFDADDCRPGSAASAIITASFWRSDFGGDPAIIDRLVVFDGVPTRIAGVLPPDFVFPASTASSTGVSPVGILRPLRLSDAERRDHNNRNYWAIGRLAPGVSAAIARARLDAVQQADRPLFRPTGVIPGAFDGVMMVPLLTAVTPRPVHEAVTYMLIAAFCVLLVAVVNVANMLVARGTERQRELAVRAAIGASRRRLMRLLVAEALTISAVGGIAGLLLARASFGIVLTELPPAFGALRLPRIDVRVALFACALSVVTGLVFGVLPALRLSRTDLAPVIGRTGSTFTARGTWGRDLLIAGEMMLAVMLIGTGALVLRSFANVATIQTGLDMAHVLSMQVAPPPQIARAPEDARAQFFRHVLDSVTSLPGVDAALTDDLLMMRGSRGSDLGVEGVDWHKLYVKGNMVTEVHVSPAYFRVMGIPISRGTTFGPATDNQPAAVVSDRFSRLAGVNPLGRELVSLRRQDPRRYRIVGVVGDARDRGPDLDPLSTVYLPFAAEGPTSLVVRTENPVAMIGSVRQAIRAVEPGAIVDRVRPLDELAWESISERRFDAFLYSAFSMSALLLSMVGVYGVIAYVVERRAREIGIRIALGATPHGVVSLVAARTLAMVAAGVGVGFAGLIALHTSLSSLVFGVQPTDPATLAAAVALIVIAASAAAYRPARRAARVDPLVALRSE